MYELDSGTQTCAPTQNAPWLTRAQTLPTSIGGPQLFTATYVYTTSRCIRRLAALDCIKSVMSISLPWIVDHRTCLLIFNIACHVMPFRNYVMSWRSSRNSSAKGALADTTCCARDVVWLENFDCTSSHDCHMTDSMLCHVMCHVQWCLFNLSERRFSIISFFM